jgi:hypothetical protein
VVVLRYVEYNPHNYVTWEGGVWFVYESMQSDHNIVVLRRRDGGRYEERIIRIENTTPLDPALAKLIIEANRS